MPADPNRVRDVFLSAVERSPEERLGFLAEACHGDADLRAEVDRLLAANADPDSILEPPSSTPADATAAFVPSHPGTVDLPGGTSATAAFDPDAAGPKEIATEDRGADRATGTFAPPETDATAARDSASPAPRAARVPTGEGIGTVIAGRYTLVEVIGEGGMGSVYLASQTDPVKRQVALKLIKTGMDSRGVLARFDAERQALALMDHPNIARIYDGGVTPAGQPFFVMELVKGVPLNEYCDRRRLSIKARLELFVAVCQAVQHAHQKGIIHRDLKPGNVLVTEVDGRPTPKVIDFGVAKATEQDLTDMSFSDTGAIVGTPTYMSPEQADPSSMDIDTRTDVYALGVMLYELLVGSPPLDARDFRRGAILEMLRMVREVDPPRPSTKLSTAEALPNIAANRSIEPARLSKLLQGELDWVVMKALEKDRNRRYDTANGFARDIQRYLADEVVEARPPSRGYRLKKFVKRNKIQVIAASLVLSALVAGIIGTSLGLREAKRAALAERAAKDVAETKRQEAERNLAFARKGNEILSSVFTGLDPRRTYANLSELKEALADNLTKAVKELDGSAVGDPREVATMQHELGQSLVGLGRFDLALEVLKKASDTMVAQLGPDYPGTLTTLNSLAVSYSEVGRTADAIAIFERVRDAQQRTLGPDHNDTLNTLNNLAAVYMEASRLPEAITTLERARDAATAKLGPNHLGTLTTLSNLARAYEGAGRTAEATAIHERVRDAKIATLGPDHPSTLSTLNDIAGVYSAAGKLPEAIALYESVRDTRIATLGLNHPSTLDTLHNLAAAYKAAGRSSDVIALYERVRDAQVAKLGPDDPKTLATQSNLAQAYEAIGKRSEAIAMFERVRDRQIATLGPDDPSTLTTLNNLASAYIDANRLPEAIPILERVRAARTAKVGPDHPDTLLVEHNLAAAYKDAGKLRESIAMFEHVRDRQIATLGPNHPSTLMTLHNLATAYQRARRLPEAISMLEGACDAMSARLGPDHLDTLRMQGELADAYRVAGDPRKAVTLLERIRRGQTARLGPDHPQTRMTLEYLTSAYRDAGRLPDAIALLEQRRDEQTASLGRDDPATLTTLNNLAVLYWRTNRLDKSVPLFEELVKRGEAKGGRQNPQVLLNVGNLGVNYKDSGRLEKAIPLLEEVYQASKRFPELREVFNPLIDAYQRVGDDAKVVELIRERLAEARKSLPEDSPELAGMLAQLGLSLSQQKRWIEAEPLLRESLTIREQKEPDDWRTFNTKSVLGGALLGQKKYDEAEPLLRAGYEGMKQREKSIPPQAGTRLPEALDRLVELSTATNQPDDVKKWRAERAKYPEAAPTSEKHK